MIGKLISPQNIILSIIGTGTLTCTIVLPIVFSGGGSGKNNYFVKVTSSNAIGSNDVHKWMCVDESSNKDEGCEFFSVHDAEKNHLLNGKSIDKTVEEQVAEEQKKKISKLSEFKVDHFFRLIVNFKKNKDQTISLISDKNKVDFSVIYDLNNYYDKQLLLNKHRYLFGKIISNDVTVDNNSSFMCSSSKQKCDIRFLDKTKINLISDINKTSFVEITKQQILKKGEYVLIDLNEYKTINHNVETITYNSNQKFTVKFEKFKEFDSSVQKTIVGKIPNTITVKKTENVQDYFIVKFDHLVNYPKHNTLLKTIEEQKLQNRNVDVSEHSSNKYKWQVQQNGVLKYVLAEIYEIKNQDAMKTLDVSVLDKEANLIQKAENWMSEHNKKHWIKMILSVNSGGKNIETFDVRHHGALIFEGDIYKHINNCFYRSSSSKSLNKCT